MLHIRVDGGFLKQKDNKEWFCTLFPDDPDAMPQDFASYEEAEAYGNERFGEGNFSIESPC